MRVLNVSALLLICAAGAAQAFTSQPLATSSSTSNRQSTSSSVVMYWTGMGGKEYIPDGFTPESYKKFKEEEAKKKQARNLGRLGPRGFESRSMQSFQEALERGEADHLMPVFNAQEKIKKGEIRPEEYVSLVL